ncbi:Putative 5'(3')-deoxyribonucleotidase [Dyadobacter sp. CECT 9623]|uniref:5'(3')-deoxyribonucleotidase n=1 Tax=Dyadobacter linearis TaxID=2823330 RepID=A0ABM8UN49_9BACT|nr:5'(3')-deoxyribonucleotidase [Dyadobacter sp. CECT 9623]CAG5068926.1 Putative 5'(3')-deoxyribonucleotidase [Dyadobacter sp. CECT 9623]
MLRLTLDMDDVLANTHEKLVNVVLNDFDTNFTEKDLMSKALREVLHPKQLTKLHRIMDSPGFFADIKVKEGAGETVYQLSKFYELFVATACMEFPNSFRDKFDWLKKHFSFIPWTNIVFCGYKSIIQSDYLIDDHVKNLVAFKGQGILFSAPHNLKETAYKRVSNWNEVSELFLPIS